MKQILYIVMTVSLMSIIAYAKMCSEFKNYNEAKKYFTSKKSGYKSLDRDHDGKPCEGLKKKEVKKSKENIRIRIYQYGAPAGFGNSFSSLSKCEKERDKLNKRNKGIDYSYKCENK